MRLAPIATPESPLCAIIFVHGLGGSASTWTAGSEETFWPKWLAEAHPQSAVYVAEYEATVSRRRVAALSLDETASQLAHLLEPLIPRGIPIVFICHSLGGTVVKALLRLITEDATHGVLLGRVRGVYFIATPHLGTPLAIPLGWIATILGQSRWDRALAMNSAPLALHRWFMEQAFWERIAIECAYENSRMFGLYVVNVRSSTIRRTNVNNIAIHRNHTDCCKPPDRADALFIRVSEFVSAAVRSSLPDRTSEMVTNALDAMADSDRPARLLTRDPF